MNASSASSVELKPCTRSTSSRSYSCRTTFTCSCVCCPRSGWLRSRDTSKRISRKSSAGYTTGGRSSGGAGTNSASVADSEPAQLARFMYILAKWMQRRPRSLAAGLARREQREGSVSGGDDIDRNMVRPLADDRARLRGERKLFASRETVRLSPLPFLAGLTSAQQREFAVQGVREIEQQTASRHKENRSRPLGARKIERQRPHDKPQSFRPRPPRSFTPQHARSSGRCRTLVRLRSPLIVTPHGVYNKARKTFVSLQDVSRRRRRSSSRAHLRNDLELHVPPNFPPLNDRRVRRSTDSRSLSVEIVNTRSISHRGPTASAERGCWLAWRWRDSRSS